MPTENDTDRIMELEAANGRLRRLLDLRDAPGELRHRLRSTIALLRAVVRRSAETPRDLQGYVAHLEDRLDAIARAQARADQYGELALHGLLADELLEYGASEGERLRLSGPDVRLTPRTGLVLALAMHELAANAVEHGALGSDRGTLEVSWNLADAEPGQDLILAWRETGLPSDSGPDREGFGTEVLSRMVPYDLGAKVELVRMSDGLLCTIRMPLLERIGRAVVSNP